MHKLLRGRIHVGAAFLLTAAVISMAASVSQAALPDYYEDPNSMVVEFTWDDTDWALQKFAPEDSIYDLYDVDPHASVDGIDTHIVLPNFIDDLDLKKMRVIMAFLEPVDRSLIEIRVEGHDPLATTAVQVFNDNYTDTVVFFDWEIRPNPDWEEVWILGNEAAGIVPGNLDFIEFVTVSVPEPGTALLASFGLMAVVGMRRRRR